MDFRYSDRTEWADTIVKWPFIFVAIYELLFLDALKLIALRDLNAYVRFESASSLLLEMVYRPSNIEYLHEFLNQFLNLQINYALSYFWRLQY